MDLQGKKRTNKGAWTVEEDRKLAEAIASNGPRRWKTIAAIAGLSRCGKSCRLRWMNYLRPNIKRGNISDQEEDLILRLHKLLGNRWSLIAGRLPGRTDNEIKNYWNSHLSKKISCREDQKASRVPAPRDTTAIIEENNNKAYVGEKTFTRYEELGAGFGMDEIFDFPTNSYLDFDMIGTLWSDNDRGTLLHHEFDDIFYG